MADSYESVNHKPNGSSFNADSYESVNHKPNGSSFNIAGDEHVDGAFPKTTTKAERDTLYEILHLMFSAILVADHRNNNVPLLHRIKSSFSHYAPRIPEASRNTSEDVILWTRQGSPLRALLVVSVGTICLVSLTGLLVFLLLVLAATFNAIVISLFVSLAVAGGFLAVFLASVTAIYFAALSIAVFAICTVSFWAIVAILTTAGWIGFFCTLWLAARKSFELAKKLLTTTSSTIANYADARHPLKMESLDSY